MVAITFIIHTIIDAIYSETQPRSNKHAKISVAMF